MDTIKLSIVIGTLNRFDQIKDCIESVLKETHGGIRVFVTDAGSTDGTVEYLQSLKSDVIHPIFVGKRLGQAKAYNAVFEKVDTPYVCWLSDDNVVVNDGLNSAIKILDSDSTIGMVGLKVQDKEGPFIKAPYIGGISNIGILNVNQGVLRSSIIQEIGGFSEEFQDYGIDPDLTARVLFSGHDVVYTRKISIHHYRRWGEDHNSEEAKRKLEQQNNYHKLYNEKYSSYNTGGIRWSFKKALWRLFQFAIQKRSGGLNSQKPLLGRIPRDWYNILNSRYIKFLDPVLTRGQAYYLRQVSPRKRSVS